MPLVCHLTPVTHPVPPLALTLPSLFQIVYETTGIDPGAEGVHELFAGFDDDGSLSLSEDEFLVGMLKVL
jgi:hypothetical protein